MFCFAAENHSYCAIKIYCHVVRLVLPIKLLYFMFYLYWNIIGILDVNKKLQADKIIEASCSFRVSCSCLIIFDPGGFGP